VVGEFGMGGVQTTYLFSGEYLQRDTKEAFSEYELVSPVVDLFNPLYNIANPFAGLTEDDIIAFASRRIVDLYSFSATSISEFGKWNVSLGARYEDIEPFTRA